MSEHVVKMIEEEDVDSRIRELAKEIDEEYKGEEVFLVCVLRGAVFFACELAKRITIPVTLDFMQVSSYGSGTRSTGEVKIVKDIDLSLRDKNVIIVEDIVDTGNTLSTLKAFFVQRKAKSVKICSLLDKPERREVNVDIDYVGFTIPDKFVVGYGLDYDQKYRNLPYVGVVEFD
ncbi:MAG: hypoxanthine phosphoribosyltransferase [Lachnospiraceae bacterium]|nr:hypoxanthine phosphoribosyltransferase [Lachnospiraceae bacterium]